MSLSFAVTTLSSSYGRVSITGKYSEVLRLERSQLTYRGRRVLLSDVFGMKWHSALYHGLSRPSRIALYLVDGSVFLVPSRLTRMPESADLSAKAAKDALPGSPVLLAELKVIGVLEWTGPSEQRIIGLAVGPALLIGLGLGLSVATAYGLDIMFLGSMSAVIGGVIGYLVAPLFGKRARHRWKVKCNQGGPCR